MDWLKLGDKNSAYFHAIVKGRRRRRTNKISGLILEDGKRMYTQDLISKEVAHYFTTLFTSQLDTTADQGMTSPLLDELTCRLSAQDNIHLISPFTEEEIRSALKEMNSNKTPGPNGFTNFFSSAIGN